MTGTLVIGAGMAGIACARALHDAGHPVRVLDKGRGIGGRMATRRVATDAGELRFDHGAQYVTARDPEFAALLDGSAAAALWSDGAAQPHHVGLPGMSGLPRALAAGLAVQGGTEVTRVAPGGTGWQVTAGERVAQAARVVLTVPAPQVAPLLGLGHPLVPALAPVHMAPCLTLMAAFPADAPAPFVSRRLDDGPLAYIARDSSKPRRPGGAVTWVAQAAPDWSAAHVEADRAEIAGRMLPLLCEATGATPGSACYQDAHRWRYARVTAPLGRPFLRDATGTLYLGGDWCLGARVEAAWTSGTAIARDILGGGDG
jgi:predicted NAD/FAD-dependent oxidoreductase